MQRGIHEISFDEYQKADGVNASLLARFDQSPAHAKVYMDAEPEPPTVDMKLGTLAHKFLLEPESVAMANYAVRPEGMDYRTKDGKDWRTAQQALGKEIITSEERNKIVGMVSSILAHPIARVAFTGGKSEVSLFCEFTYGGTIMRKGRIDHLSEGDAIVDLKTTVDASPKAFEKTIWNFLYHMKAAYYLDLAKDLDLPHRSFVFVAVEKEPPYAVAVYQLDTDSIQAGRGLYLEYVSRYIECRHNNRWPGYAETVQMIGLPAWAQKQAA